jgi:hypothetical protein
MACHSIFWPRTGRRAAVAPARPHGRTVARLHGIDAVFSSPLSRAVSTAAFYAEALGAQVIVIEDLTEVHHGAWGGLTRPEIEARFPGMNERRQQIPGGLPARPFGPPEQPGQPHDVPQPFRAISLATRAWRSRSPTASSRTPRPGCGRVTERLEGDAAWAVIDRIAREYAGQPALPTARRPGGVPARAAVRLGPGLRVSTERTQAPVRCGRRVSQNRPPASSATPPPNSQPIR